jgi:hypothetical protein
METEGPAWPARARAAVHAAVRPLLAWVTAAGRKALPRGGSEDRTYRAGRRMPHGLVRALPRGPRAAGTLYEAPPARQEGNIVTADEDPDVLALHELRRSLARRKIAIDDPVEGTPVYFRGLRGAHCELGLRRTGEVTWTCLPQAQDLDPAQVVRIALALLAPDAAPVPARELPLPDKTDRMLAAAGRVLAGAGLAAEPANISYGDGEPATPGLRIANPSTRDRGQLQVSGEGEFLWEFRFTCPGSPEPGLSPHDVALAIESALEKALGQAGEQ